MNWKTRTTQEISTQQMKPNSISIFKSKSANSKKGKFLSLQMYKYFFSCFRPTTFPPSFEKKFWQHCCCECCFLSCANMMGGGESILSPKRKGKGEERDGRGGHSVPAQYTWQLFCGSIIAAFCQRLSSIGRVLPIALLPYNTVQNDS